MCGSGDAETKKMGDAKSSTNVGVFADSDSRKEVGRAEKKVSLDLNCRVT